MAKAKVAITLDEATIGRLDRLVAEAIFPNRSQGIQIALEEKLERIERNRLAQECAKLDPIFEKSLAEEGIAEDLSEWPEY
jgi:metal-responsive CopG/Arc/MetJ family transcriptional regulator